MPRKRYPSRPVHIIVGRLGRSGPLLRMPTVKVDGCPLMLRGDTARTPPNLIRECMHRDGFWFCDLLPAPALR
jgi:hypothetical protein